MEETSEIDLLIIGQGLAGSALAMRALGRGYRVMVLDDPSQNHTSRMAAGLFNPVTGRNFTKTWLADALFPCLIRYYREVERLTAKSFFHEIPLHRPFTSIEQQNDWTVKSTDREYAPYVEQVTSKNGFDPAVDEPFGGITLKQSGYLDACTYLDAVRDHLQARGAFRAGWVDPGELEVSPGGVRLGNLRAKRAVFCQGVHNRNNPWFARAEVRPLKGEFLTVQSGWRKNVIVNRGVYMVPAGRPDEWRVGATYNWNDDRPETTSWAKDELVQKLEAFFRFPYSVKAQHWGVRPTTRDRKPILGKHPDHASLLIFNGLGTKGVSLAPYFSDVLIRWMENKGMIGKEADVSRFY